MTRCSKRYLWSAVVAVLYGLFSSSIALANILPDTSDVARIHESKGFLPDDETFAVTEEDFGAATNAGSPGSSIVLGFFQNYTLTGGAGETVTLNLQNFILSGNSTLTLEGTATTSFVINVSRKFSLADYAKITLSGGVDLRKVFFNATGKGKVSLGGNSVLRGMLRASSRTVVLRGRAIVNGSVTARRVKRGRFTQIIPPPITSP